MYQKDVLRAGTFYPPGRGPVTFTAADLAAMCRTGNRMLEANWAPPVCVEHQDGAGPGRRLSLAELRARGFVGYPERFRVVGDTLVADLPEPADPEDARLAKKLAYVSPEIRWDYRTGDGRVWKGPCIRHIALTPTPVNNRQRPLGAVAMGLAAGGPLRLSLADHEDAMHDPENPSVNPETPDPTPETPDPANTGEPSPPPPDEAADADLAQAFLDLGLDVPADVISAIPAEAKAVLASVIRTKLMGDLPMADDADEPLEEPTGEPAEGAAPPSPGPGAYPGGPVGLSLAGGGTLDPQKAHDQLLAAGRRDLERRANALLRTGRVTPAVHGRLVADLKAVQLSLTPEAELAGSDVATRIRAYEDLPANHANGRPAKGAGGPTRLSLATPAEPPPDRTPRPPTADEARKLNDEMDAMVRR